MELPVVAAVAAAGVDEAHARVPGAEVAVHGALHELRQVERIRRTHGVVDICGAEARPEIAAWRIPAQAGPVVVPVGLSRSERLVDVVGSERPPLAALGV